MPGPPCPNVRNLNDFRRAERRVTDVFNGFCIDAVQKVYQNRFRCGFEQPQDHPDDDESHERVNKLPAGERADRSSDNGQAGQAIGPGVVAIRHQRCAGDTASHANPKDRHRLVAREPDESRRHQHPRKLDIPRVDEPVDRCVRGDHCAGENKEEDDHPRQVFNSPVSVCEPAARFSPHKDEGDPQRNCGSCITEVVNGVGQQSDTARNKHDHELKDGRYPQQDKRPLHRPDSGLCTGQ